MSSGLRKVSGQERQRLEELSPSAKLVYYVLRNHKWIGAQEITDISLLPPRTTRYALNRLSEADLLVERIRLGDSRVREYALASSVDGAQHTRPNQRES